MFHSFFKSAFLSLTFLVSALGGNAQEIDEAVQSVDSKIKIGTSFAHGLLTEKTQSLQVQGVFGYRPFEQPIEFRADGFYFLGNIGERPRFTINHQLYLGAIYHFRDKQRVQPYSGIQPGIAYSQSSEYGTIDSETGELVYQKTVNPVISGVLGVDFFSRKWIYGFLETRYIFGRHTSDTYPIYLDELRFSLGLGVHF